jgi:trimeric autotransporter adhesin
MSGLKFNPLLLSGLQFVGGTASISIGTPIGGADNNAILVTDGSGNLSDKVLTNGQVLIGSTGAAPVAATLTGTTNQINIANGAGSITLSLPQSIATTSSPTFANLNLTPSGYLDTTTAGTLAIGTSRANVINIGNSGSTVNIQGTTLYENVTQLQVSNPIIDLNVGGGVGSASNSGLAIEENSIITAYAQTSSDRNSWIFKAPNTAGIATITPGTGGITLNQTSHNPVTIGTANGLSLSTQVLSLASASGSTTGALLSTDWTTFNNKQPAGNYITALTGDATASGPGSVAITLATVNSNVGSFGSASSVMTQTVNAKGLTTAAASVAIQITESQVTNLTTDLAAKMTTVSVASSNGFAGTSSGTSTPTLTLTTTVTGLLKGNSGAISAATAGTDYVAPVTGDITPTTYSGLANNTANQTITGLTFANTVSSFEALLNIQISATTNTFTTVKLLGTRQAATWATYDLAVESGGTTITGMAFNITSGGSIQISIGNITGFTSGTIKFRASTLS